MPPELSHSRQLFVLLSTAAVALSACGGDKPKDQAAGGASCPGRVIPRRWWPLINLYLVTWGQNTCRPVYPRCHECAIRRDCRFALR